MSDPNTQHETDAIVRNEIAGWSPRRAADMHDVLRRADRGWQRPVMTYSGASAVVLALVLVAALVILLLGTHLTATDGIRERLLAH